MRHVLFHQREKPDHPIRQSDLAKIVTEEVKTKGASTGIIANAQFKLIAELGLELKKIDIGPARAETKSSGVCSAALVMEQLQLYMQTLAVVAKSICGPSPSPVHTSPVQGGACSTRSARPCLDQTPLWLAVTI